MSIAPTGTIGTMLGVSTGIEPHFVLSSYVRHTRLGDITVPSYPGYTKYDAVYFGAQELVLSEHLDMLEVAIQYVDSSISKTVNLPANATVDDVANVYWRAFEMGLKGITVYRDHSRGTQVLERIAEDRSSETIECPECGSADSHIEGTCYVCNNCGYSICSL